MSNGSDLHAFYIITKNDVTGETARGPYTMSEAESLVQVDEDIITRRRYSSFQEQKSAAYNKSQRPGYAKMLREIRNWGIVLLILGAIQLFSSGFENTWAILLIIVGLSSFYFRSPAIFVTYGTTMVWAAISNALSGSSGWLFFSLFQVYLAYTIFRQFFQFRTIFNSSPNLESENALETQIYPDKAARPFPWASFFLGLISFIGIITAFLGAILYVGLSGNEQIPAFLGLIEGLSIIFAVWGFSMGLAAILSKYQYKVFSIIGMVASGLVLVIEVGLGLLG